jgi:hypothetical protein
MLQRFNLVVQSPLTASLDCLHAVRSTYGPSNAINPAMQNAFDDSE